MKDLTKGKIYIVQKWIEIMKVKYQWLWEKEYWFNTITWIMPKWSCYNLSFNKIDNITKDLILLYN